MLSIIVNLGERIALSPATAFQFKFSCSFNVSKKSFLLCLKPQADLDGAALGGWCGLRQGPGVPAAGRSEAGVRRRFPCCPTCRW